MGSNYPLFGIRVNLSHRYPAGSVLRVSLKNFVTYTSAEFFPGPNMNLVIGPNGTGKSTLVCAICLGLGYSPNVLGRATAVGDFVQHGKDVAEIEIELSTGSERSLVIKRKIKRDKNASTYFINGMFHRIGQNIDLIGKQDTLQKVQQHMKEFNIQIDNLWYPFWVSLLTKSISSARQGCIFCPAYSRRIAQGNTTRRRRRGNGQPLAATLRSS